MALYLLWLHSPWLYLLCTSDYTYYGRWRSTRTRMALRTLALLTVALLTVALLTVALLTVALLTMTLLTMTLLLLTTALLTMSLLTMAGGGACALGRREWYGAARKVKLNKGLQTAEQPRVHCVCSSARGRAAARVQPCSGQLKYVVTPYGMSRVSCLSVHV